MNETETTSDQTEVSESHLPDPMMSVWRGYDSDLSDDTLDGDSVRGK